MVEANELIDVVLVDTALAARLEQTEGLANARFVEARIRQSSESMAAWIQIAGAYAMFDGVDSPMTQSFGLGMFSEVMPSDLEAIEVFFRDRKAPVLLEVSPLASGELLSLLNQRNYRPVEYTSVMCRRIGPDISLPKNRSQQIQVRVISGDEAEQ